MRPVPSVANPAISKSERYWIWGAILVGAILRLSFPGRMAVEHFDEGVYASNFYFSAEEGYRYPAQHLYAPPLLPLAIEWTMIIVSLSGIRPTGLVPMIPSLIAGIATIPSIWHVARRWFGPGAGIVAAWLVATSDFHASYSRAALTDVPVCLFLLWGVYFMEQALQTGTHRSIVLAGLFTGLAWWTKYNGWLPLAIGLSGGLAWQLFLPQKERHFRNFASRWTQVALVAFAFWSPVLSGLQRYGGYSAVAANHRSYVVGLHGWVGSAVRQLAVVGRYENWFGALSEITNDWLARTSTDPNLASASGANPNWLNSWFNGMSMILSNITLPLLLLISISALTFTTFRFSSGSSEKASQQTGLSHWLVLAWLIGLTITTPLYHPYPRLMLPWLVATFLGMAYAVSLWLDWPRTTSPQGFGSPGLMTQRIWFATVVTYLSVFCLRLVFGAVFSWHDRTHLAVVSAKVVKHIEDSSQTRIRNNPSVVYVRGVPAIVFALRSSGSTVAVPVQEVPKKVSTDGLVSYSLVLNELRDRRGLVNEAAKIKDSDPNLPEVTWNVERSHLVRFDDGDFNARSSNSSVRTVELFSIPGD